MQHLKICRKPSFSKKFSLIFTLIVQATLSVKQKIFFDSVNFIVLTWDMKNKQIYHYFLLEKTVKLYQLSTSFQVAFEVCLKGYLK